MKTFRFGLLLLAGSIAWLQAEGATPSMPSPRLQAYPWMPLSKWYSMHAEDVKVAELGQAKVVFWGDSITEGWHTRGQSVWDAHFAALGVANFGIGGDMTQNLIWRLENGSGGNLDPANIVLLIGTNNFGLADDTPTEVAAGVFAVVSKLGDVYPDAEILLMAVFPRNESPDHPNRAKISTLNSLIKPLGRLEKVTYADIGTRFLLPDGRIPTEMMPDYLHLSEEAYKIWAEVILDWMNR